MFHDREKVSMLDAIVNGLMHLLSWPVLSMMFIGILVGTVIGIVPGLGGILGLSLILPFTFGMDPTAAFALLLGMHAVVHTGGSIPSILINAPGTGPNAATCLEGFPLAEQGKGGRALGAALTASGVGGVIGALFMALVIPVVRPIITSFGPPEFFMLAVLGISLISMVSGESMIKGLIVGCLGLLLSFVGWDPQTGVVRYGFDLLYLDEGLNLVPVTLGIFALAEVIALIAGKRAIAHKSSGVGHDVLEGVKDVFRKWWLTFRCSLIGCFIGVIPGIGGEVSSWICYGHAAQSSKEPESFGKGNIEGVIAPEAANNSKEAGALIPTIAFGIPGSSGMAILLGAFLILGLTPGPTILVKNLDLIWSFIWLLAMANVIAAVGCISFAGQLSRLTKLEPGLLAPFILVFVAIGSFLTTNSVGDIIVTLIMGLFGYVLKVHDYPRAPLLLGLILGGMAENYLHLSLNLWGLKFFFRPLTLALLVILVLSVSLPIYLKKRRVGKEASAC